MPHHDLQDRADELFRAAAVKDHGYPWSSRTLQRYRDHGKGPAYIHAAGKVYYRRADLDDYLDKLRVVPVREGPVGRSLR